MLMSPSSEMDSEKRLTCGRQMWLKHHLFHGNSLSLNCRYMLETSTKDSVTKFYSNKCGELCILNILLLKTIKTPRSKSCACFPRFECHVPSPVLNALVQYWGNS